MKRTSGKGQATLMQTGLNGKYAQTAQLTCSIYIATRTKKCYEQDDGTCLLRCTILQLYRSAITIKPLTCNVELIILLQCHLGQGEMLRSKQTESRMPVLNEKQGEMGILVLVWYPKNMWWCKLNKLLKSAGLEPSVFIKFQAHLKATVSG